MWCVVVRHTRLISCMSIEHLTLNSIMVYSYISFHRSQNKIMFIFSMMNFSPLRRRRWIRLPSKTISECFQSLIWFFYFVEWRRQREWQIKGNKIRKIVHTKEMICSFLTLVLVLLGEQTLFHMKHKWCTWSRFISIFFSLSLSLSRSL